MKILSMTATFGKLEHQTLTLKPGLNIIEAPNEWGKSTWCAFITAMLYGIETRAHSTKNALADKEHYAPWSGTPLSGRMDLLWNGHAVTIQRSTKGRNLFGVFKAYETDSGLDIPELNAVNCGQMLLGVEKNVFLRSGFLRNDDLPVTQDEALRRRLNDIVTTGDESGTADALAQTLRDLKNRCRANRSTGLLPQAEAQRNALRNKLAELEELRFQSRHHTHRLTQLDTWNRELENHKAALDYRTSRENSQKYTDALAALAALESKEQTLRDRCATLPSPEEADSKLLRLQQLRRHWDSLLMETQLLTQAPRQDTAFGCFRDLSPEAAVEKARKDAQTYSDLTQKRSFPWWMILPLILSIPALLIPHWIGVVLAGILAVAGVMLVSRHFSGTRRRNASAVALLQHYHPLSPVQWITAAQSYADSEANYAAALAQHQQIQQQLEARRTALIAEISAVTDGKTLAQGEQFYLDAQRAHQELSAAVREHRTAANLVQALQNPQQATAPTFPDKLEYPLAETQRLLSDCAREQRQLHQQLDITKGRMEALGSIADIPAELDAVNKRITALEETYAALELAQSTLADATAQLQRRFAPQITSRAQTLFSRLTQGRYNRLALSEDFGIHAGTIEETILHSALWRSDGTTDQLYLALRFAMAEALTPEAPLILDDALVRFDDRRLEEALRVLQDESDKKQVIVFTCQSRENRILNNLS